MRERVALAFVVAVGLAAATPTTAADSGAIDACHQAIFSGLEAVSWGRADHLTRCLKVGKYDGSCVATDFHTEVHENELRRRIAAPASACQVAIAGGATIGDFGPADCANEGAGCGTEVPLIAGLDDLAQCLICQQRGHDFTIREVLGMPRAQPTDLDERRCTRRVAKLTANTIRKSLFDVAVCARGGEKPVSCPVDATAASRFGRALSTFPASVAACGVDEGHAPGLLVNLCDGAAIDAASLSECFAGLARCLACRNANSALGQQEDCVALSGLPGCNGMP